MPKKRVPTIVQDYNNPLLREVSDGRYWKVQEWS